MKQRIDTRLKFFNDNIRRARGRNDGKVITITGEDCMAQAEKQGWVCTQLGVPLQFTRGGTIWGGKWCNPWVATIDRIDNSKGYTQDNIQIVSWSANQVKGHLNDDEFLYMCKRVTEYAKRKSR